MIAQRAFITAMNFSRSLSALSKAFHEAWSSAEPNTNRMMVGVTDPSIA